MFALRDKASVRFTDAVVWRGPTALSQLMSWAWAAVEVRPRWELGLTGTLAGARRARCAAIPQPQRWLLSGSAATVQPAPRRVKHRRRWVANTFSGVSRRKFIPARCNRERYPSRSNRLGGPNEPVLLVVRASIPKGAGWGNKTLRQNQPPIKHWHYGLLERTPTQHDCQQIGTHLVAPPEGRSFLLETTETARNPVKNRPQQIEPWRVYPLQQARRATECQPSVQPCSRRLRTGSSRLLQAGC